MADEKPENKDVSTQQTPGNIPPASGKKSSRALLILFLAFFGLVTIVFLTQRRDTIAWVKDYNAGVEMAKEQNKPILLAFYKQFTPMSTNAWLHTYTDRKVIKYVEANFIPIIINVDEQPEIASHYHIGYYPTHYIKRADSNELFGPMLGYDPPELFISKLKGLYEKMNASNKQK
jgi:hypothetical protein